MFGPMPDLDLKPTEYRVTRGPLQRIRSVLPPISRGKAMFISTACGVWAASVYASAYMTGNLAPNLWLVLAAALAPAAVMLLWWFLSGAEDRPDLWNP